MREEGISVQGGKRDLRGRELRGGEGVHRRKTKELDGSGDLLGV